MWKIYPNGRRFDLLIQTLEAEDATHDRFVIYDRHVQCSERMGLWQIVIRFVRHKVVFILANGTEGEGLDALTQFLNHRCNLRLLDEESIHCCAPALRDEEAVLAMDAGQGLLRCEEIPSFDHDLEGRHFQMSSAGSEFVRRVSL